MKPQAGSALRALARRLPPLRGVLRNLAQLPAGPPGLYGLIQALVRDRVNISFMQIGANDGKSRDPLHKHIMLGGWRGVVVEPVPYIYERLRQTYAGVQGLSLVCAAVAEAPGSKRLYVMRPAGDEERASLPVWYDQIGSFVRENLLKSAAAILDIESRIESLEVPCVTLMELCERHQLLNLDLLHTDVEGYDGKILMTLDFNRVKPRLILFEHKHLPPQELTQLQTLLAENSYGCLAIGDDTLCLRGGAWQLAAPETRALWKAMNGTGR